MNVSLTFPSNFFSHHAYLIEGGPDSALHEVERTLNEVYEFTTHGNPDYVPFQTQTFTIEAARQLKEQAADRPMKHEHKVFVISCSTMTREAQNALLKLFEDPYGNSIFVLLVPTAAVLLPTLQSRLSNLGSVAGNGDASSTNAAKDFLKGSPAERLKATEYLVKEKDKAGAIALLNELEAYLHTYDLQSKDVAGALADVEMCRQYLMDRAPSVKMILEYLCARLPVL